MDASDSTRTPVTFASHDGHSTCHGYLWWQEDPLAAEEGSVRPAGVVQLVHGMSEHIERYDDFARFLVGQGYLVAGHDHIGHGKSSPRGQWGVMPLKNGRECLVEDVHSLRRLVEGIVPASTPYFIFGHSMGSFVLRCYLGEHADGLAGAIVCGTGTVAGSASVAGRSLARLMARMRGADYKSKLLHNMAEGAYAKEIPNRLTDLDWLSYNRANVDAYQAAEDCGFAFGTSGYATLTDLTATCCKPSWPARYPADLPLLFIAGDGDPVGAFGKGVRKAVDQAKLAGCNDVTCIIYDHMRHEILNEDERQKVYDDVLGWLEVKR